MSIYEEEVVERGVAVAVELLRAGPARWKRIRDYLYSRGAELDPAYQGRLIDSFIFRRVADELQRRSLAEKQEWWSALPKSELEVEPDRLIGRESSGTNPPVLWSADDCERAAIEIRELRETLRRIAEDESHAGDMIHLAVAVLERNK